jgi:4-carboxymuconolactone decarboxylase
MTTSRDGRLACFSVAIVLGRWDELAALRRAAPPGEPDRRWREALLQAHLFAGFPRVVEASEVIAQAGGLGRPEPDELAPMGERFAEGRALFERIYAENAAEVRASLEGYHPLLARWIEGHAYGRVLSRAGLAPHVREILAVACLVALGQERQLASHVRGALRLGAAEAELEDALDAIAYLVPADVLERGRRVVERFAGPG